MATFQIGLATVTENEGAHSFVGKPIGDRGGIDHEGSVRLAKITTPDGLIVNVGVTSWPDGASDLRLIDFIAGPDSYRRLERAGNMSLNPVSDGVVGVLRVLKYTGRDYPSLQSATWDQLDAWLGEDAAIFLRGMGASFAGTHGEARPAAQRFRNDPAIVADPSTPTTLFAAYALTRVIPLAVDFGRDGVEVLH